MSLYALAFVIFAAIAAGGVLMAGLIGSGRPVPKQIPVAHGLGALAGLTVLLYANLTGSPSELAWWAFGIFAAGSLGGLLLFKFVFKQGAPMLIIAGHASLGLVGLYLLLRVAV